MASVVPSEYVIQWIQEKLEMQETEVEILLPGQLGDQVLNLRNMLPEKSSADLLLGRSPKQIKTEQIDTNTDRCRMATFQLMVDQCCSLWHQSLRLVIQKQYHYLTTPKILHHQQDLGLTNNNGVPLMLHQIAMTCGVTQTPTRHALQFSKDSGHIQPPSGAVAYSMIQAICSLPQELWPSYYGFLQWSHNL